MNKDDYIVWRDSPITREFMKVVVKEMDNTIADLVSNAGDDSLRDRQRRGMIEGLKWLTEWVPTVEDTDVNIDSEEDDNAITSTGSSGSY